MRRTLLAAGVNILATVVDALLPGGAGLRRGAEVWITRVVAWYACRHGAVAHPETLEAAAAIPVSGAGVQADGFIAYGKRGTDGPPGTIGIAIAPTTHGNIACGWAAHAIHTELAHGAVAIREAAGILIDDDTC